MWYNVGARAQKNILPWPITELLHPWFDVCIRYVSGHIHPLNKGTAPQQIVCLFLCFFENLNFVMFNL